MNNTVIVLVVLYRFQNFSVRTMHAYLEKIDGVKPHTIFFKNCQTNIFKYPSEQEEEAFARTIEDLNPTLVGFSVISPFVPIARKLTKIVKEKSSALVIWGGTHPTVFPDNCLTEECDMLCVGEGEGAMQELVQSLRDQKPYHEIKNLYVKNNGQIVKNSMRPLLQDLDSLPFPSYGNDAFYFIEANRVSREDPLLLEHDFWVHPSRGCPFACSYCVNSLLHRKFKDLGPYVRTRSVSNIIAEIKENMSLRGDRMDSVVFQGDFGKDEKWLEEFSTQYKKEIGLPFFVQYHPRDLNPWIITKLVEAGLGTLSFGIEAGSDEVRNRVFHRPGKNTEIVELAQELAKHDIKVTSDLILNNPYDTEESLKETIELLLQFPKQISLNLYSLQFFPNYPLTKKAIADELILPENADADNLFEKTTKEWSFIPKLLPHTKKQILQNIIWLIAGHYENNRVVSYAVFGNSFGSRLCLSYLNIKSILFAKIFGIGGIVGRYRWLALCVGGMRHILKGDFKIFFHRVRKYLYIIREWILNRKKSVKNEI